MMHVAISSLAMATFSRALGKPAKIWLDLTASVSA